MQVTTSIYLRNQARARKVINADQNVQWADSIHKVYKDIALEEIRQRTVWHTSRIGELSWSLAEYWVELARSYMPAWEMNSFGPYIQVVTGSLSKTIDFCLNPRGASGAAINPFISEIIIDFAPKDEVRQEHSAIGTFPTGAKVTLGTPIADYTVDTLTALTSYIYDAEKIIRQLINSLFSAQTGQREWVVALLEFPEFMQISSTWQTLSADYQRVLDQIGSQMQTLRQENEQRIQEAAQNRIQAALEKQRNSGGA